MQFAEATFAEIEFAGILVNEAPVSTPTSISIFMQEGDVRASSIPVSDAEMEDVTITVSSGAEPLFLSRDKALHPTQHATPFTVGLTLSPGIGDAGVYSWTYTFTDDFGNSDTTTVLVTVYTASAISKQILQLSPLSAFQGLFGAGKFFYRKR